MGGKLPDVLVVFGSASDKEVYVPLLEGLEKEKIPCSFRILSAHKTPEELKEEIQGTRAKIIIAGAGLAAALPGAIASYSIKPVVGIPCKTAFEGLDSFLSILQMPPGIPVLAVGVGRWDAALAEVKKILLGIKSVHIVQRTTAPEVKSAVDKCRETLDWFGVKYDIIKNYECGCTSCLCIGFVPVEELDLLHKVSSTVIAVPISNSSNVPVALAIMEKYKQGFFVGLNNAENAAIAAVELIGLDGKYSKKLLEYREKKRAAVLEADGKEGKVHGRR